MGSSTMEWVNIIRVITVLWLTSPIPSTIKYGAWFLLKAVKIAPDEPDFLINLASVYGVLGDYEEAIAIFEKCLDLDTDQVSLRKNLGIAYMAMGDYANAIMSLEEIPPEIRRKYPEIKKMLEHAREKTISSDSFLMVS